MGGIKKINLWLNPNLNINKFFSILALNPKPLHSNCEKKPLEIPTILLTINLYRIKFNLQYNTIFDILDRQIYE